MRGSCRTVLPVAVGWIALIACASLGGACGGESRGPIVQPSQTAQRQCTQPRAGVFGARPLSNRTAHTIEVEGTGDMLVSAMTSSGCFTVVERDKLTILLDEMKLCGDDNPDKQFFDCGSFAKKGHVLGVTDFVLGDIIVFEGNARGADLSAKLPGIGGIEAGRSYDAVAINLRVVDVESGRVKASTITHALVPTDKGGLGLSAGGSFDLRVAVHDRTPLGDALSDMIVDALRKLDSSLGR